MNIECLSKISELKLMISAHQNQDGKDREQAPQPSRLEKKPKKRLMPLLAILAVSLLYLSGDQAQPKVTISECDYPPPPPAITINQAKSAAGQSAQLLSSELPSDPSYDPYYSIWEIFYITDLMETLSQSPESANTIDILTVETAATQSVPDVDKLMADQIVYANVAAARTGSGVRAKHVGVYRSQYEETFDYHENLYRLENCRDGHLDEVCQARTDLGADQVTVFISPEVDTYCGMAYIPGGIDQESLAKHALAIATFHPGCLYEGIFAHEKGHNLTMGHNIEDSGGPTFFQWAHGARTREIVLLGYFASRSIMSYRFSDNTPYNIGFPGYSSPELKISGVTLGNAETANNGLVYQTVAPIFAENSPAKIGADLTVFPPAQSIYLPTEPITLSVKSLLPQSVIMLKSVESPIFRLYRTRTGNDNAATLSVESQYKSPINKYSINVNGGHPITFEHQYLVADKRVGVTVVMPEGQDKTGFIVSAPFARQSTRTNGDGVATLNLVGRDQTIRAIGSTPDKELLCWGEVEYLAGDIKTVYEIPMGCSSSHNVFLPIVGKK